MSNGNFADYTVLLIDDSFASAVDVMVELSRSGMLDEFALVDQDLNATVVTAGNVVTTDLALHLASLRISRLRVMRWSCGGSPISSEHRHFIEEIRFHPIEGQELEIASIVVPRSDAKIDAEAFVSWFTFNAIVDTEDGVGEPSFKAVPVSRPEQQHAIAANVCATVSGLWRFLDEGPLDQGRFRQIEGGLAPSTDGAAQRLRVRPIRVFTRIVDLGDIIGESMNYALQERSGLPTPPGTVSHGNPQLVIEEVLRQLFPSAGPSPLGFTYIPTDPMPPPETEKMGILAAIRRYVAEFFIELSELPRQAVRAGLDRLRHRVEQAVQNATFGQDSMIRVQIEGTADPDMLNPEARVQLIQTASNIEPRAASPTPSTWWDLTTLVLSLADGSQPPAEIELKSIVWNGNPGVITDVACLVSADTAGPDGGSFVLSTEDLELLGWEEKVHRTRKIPGCDAVGAAMVLTRLDELASEVTESAGPSEEQGATVNSATVTLAPPDGPPLITEGLGTVEGGSFISQPEDHAAYSEAVLETHESQVDSADPPVGGLGAENTNGERKTEASTLDLAGPPNDSGRLVVLRDRFDAWIQVRDETLLWRVAMGVGYNAQKALDDFASTDDDLKRLDAAASGMVSEERRSRRKFVRRALGIIGGILLVVAVALFGIMATFLFNAVVWVGVIVASLFTSLWAMVRTARERVQQKNRAKRLETVPEYLLRKRQQGANEYARLTWLYGQLLDWAQVEALALHRPLGDPDADPGEPWRSTVGALSFVSGEPHVNEEEMAGLSLRIAQQVASKGWLTTAYRRQRELVLASSANLAANVGNEENSPESDVDLDGSVVRVGTRRGVIEVLKPRRQLLEQLRNGRVAEQYRRDYFARLRATTGGKSPIDLIEWVETDFRGLNEPRRTPEQLLLPPLSGPMTKFACVEGAALMHGSEPTVRLVGVTRGVLSEHERPSGIEIPVSQLPDRFTLASVRIDIGAPLQPNDFSNVIHDSVEETYGHVGSDDDKDFGPIGKL